MYAAKNPSPVVTTVPLSFLDPVTTTADKKTKPKPLQRRKSLNPRLMAPPGLESLENREMVAVRQQMQADISAGCGSPNTYKIWDINDEQLFFASEDSSCLCRWTCGPNRKFSLSVFTTEEDEVLNFHRSTCRCDCCCCLDCYLCLQKLYVVDCLGRTLGAIKQTFSIFNSKFDVVDHDDNVLLKIIGPYCPCRCCAEISFTQIQFFKEESLGNKKHTVMVISYSSKKIYNKTGERKVGRIQKKWGGERTDNVNVDHEYFDVTFPGKLDIVDKALIIGAAFLISFMYFEMS